MMMKVFSFIILFCNIFYGIGAVLSRFRSHPFQRLISRPLHLDSNVTSPKDCVRLCSQCVYCSGANFLLPNICELMDATCIAQGSVEHDEMSQYLEAIEQEKKWSVVFRLSAGTGLEVLNYWSSPFPMNTDLMTPILQPPDGDDIFLSSIVPNRWGIVQQVRIAMYTDGEEVMFTTFNASGSTQLTWMDPDHIIHSTYTDIIGQPHYEDFSVAGNIIVDPNGFGPPLLTKRRFNAFRSYSGCGDDLMWFTVIEKEGRCPEFQTQPLPALFYSTSKVMAEGRDAAVADTLVISVKT